MMSDTDALQQLNQAANVAFQEIQNLLGTDKIESVPANVGRGRSIALQCKAVMKGTEPLMYDYLTQSDSPDGTLISSVLQLLGRGMWESAWAIAQLHYDQVLKKEVVDGHRHHKGHPLCGLAILAREMGLTSVERHYATLSALGDLYWVHEEPELAHGGYGLTMLERHEPVEDLLDWRDSLKEQFDTADGKPAWLEAYLAARWFSGATSNCLLGVDFQIVTPSMTFADNLLTQVLAKVTNDNSSRQGTMFEAAAGLTLSTTPGFVVGSARRTSDSQTDLVVDYSPARFPLRGMPAGRGLVECKSGASRIGVQELRDFGAKCGFHRVDFGILIAASGLTGTGICSNEHVAAELVRRRFLIDGLPILVVTMDQLRSRYQALTGILSILQQDLDELVFGSPA